LGKAVVAALIGKQVAREALGHVLNLGIDYWSPTRRLHERALHWAQQLGQTRTYDAHYLAVAEDADADFWTADQRLLNNVIQHGGIRIRLIGEAP
jgi:predicted nucleic acid-binding protein